MRTDQAMPQFKFLSDTLYSIYVINNFFTLYRESRSIKIPEDIDWHVEEVQINPNKEFYLHQFVNVKQDENGKKIRTFFTRLRSYVYLVNCSKIDKFILIKTIRSKTKLFLIMPLIRILAI